MPVELKTLSTRSLPILGKFAILLHAMGKQVKRFVFWFTRTFQFAPDLFDFGAGGGRLLRDDGTPNSPYWFDSTAEAWRYDWQNIGGDFRRAAVRLEREIA